jgi:C1A family cysteine protease
MSLLISPAGKRYGAKREAPDPRDLRAHFIRSAPIRPVVDLREFCGPIKNQRDLGSCTGHAGSEGWEWIDRKYFKRQRIFSAGFLYDMELITEGSYPTDAGADPRTICKVLNQIGIVEESEYPYTNSIATPSPEIIARAAQFKMGGYHVLKGGADVLSCLADPTPWPVMMGFPVYSSFEGNQIAATGIMPLPDPTKEMLLGGHEVLIVGYNLNTGYAIVQNSWDSTWGDKGFFYAPMAMLDWPDVSLRIIHPGHW